MTFFWSHDATVTYIGITILMGLSMVPLHSLTQDNQNEVYPNFVGYVMPLALEFMSNDANNVINAITTFLRLK